LRHFSRHLPHVPAIVRHAIAVVQHNDLAQAILVGVVFWVLAWLILTGVLAL
jgi:hypothetical protein